MSTQNKGLISVEESKRRDILQYSEPIAWMLCGSSSPWHDMQSSSTALCNIQVFVELFKFMEIGFAVEPEEAVAKSSDLIIFNLIAVVTACLIGTYLCQNNLLRCNCSKFPLTVLKGKFDELPWVDALEWESFSLRVLVQTVTKKKKCFAICRWTCWGHR